MKTIAKIWIWLIVLAASGFGLYRAYNYTLAEESPAQAEPQQQEEREAPLVRVTAVETGAVRQTAYVTGTVMADQSVRLTPELSGVLETFSLPDGTPVQEGLTVQSGDVVGVVEHEEVKAALEEAKSSLQVARSGLEQAKIKMKDAERERNRMVALYEEGTVTEQKRDSAVTAYQVARANLQLARDEVARAEARLKRARVRFNKAKITSPITGIISKKYVDKGNYVSPSTPVVKVMDINHVEVKGGVSGDYLPLLQEGATPARVATDAYPEEDFTGKVDRIQPELDAGTRTVEITVRMENPNKLLRPGMFARVRLLLREKTGVPVVPDVALLTEG
ncbi:MAG: efflux RND transporter periplasmic adaptor subunit, partial [Planctomycetota bacterium]